jgi:acyl carrier protein
MSGISFDGVGAALIQIDGEKIADFGPTLYRPYAAEERAVLRRALGEVATLTDRTAWCWAAWLPIRTVDPIVRSGARSRALRRTFGCRRCAASGRRRVGSSEMSDIAGDVIAIIAKNKRTAKPVVELSDRLDDLGLDSLAAVDLIFDLEEKFDITIPYNANNPKPEFETVGEAVSAIEKLVAKKNSSPT